MPPAGTSLPPRRSLDWLTARGLTLASCPQGDLDEWTAAATASQRGPAGHFIRWARNQKLTSLDFPATRWAGPTRVIESLFNHLCGRVQMIPV